MKKLLQEICRKVAERKEKCLGPKNMPIFKNVIAIFLHVEAKSCRKFHQSRKANGERWRSQMPIIFGRGLKNIKQRFCCSPRNRMFHSLTMALKGIFVWQKSNRKYLDVFAASGMPMLTAGFQAIYRVWRPLVAIQIALAGNAAESDFDRGE